MFWLFSGTSPVGDLKMFLISQCFWLWETTCWHSHCVDVCLLGLSGAYPGASFLLLSWRSHVLQWVWGAKEGDWKKNLVDHLVLITFLVVVRPLRGQMFIADSLACLAPLVGCAKSFTCLVQLQWHTATAWHQEFFQPHLDSVYFHARLHFGDGNAREGKIWW